MTKIVYNSNVSREHFRTQNFGAWEASWSSIHDITSLLWEYLVELIWKVLRNSKNIYLCNGLKVTNQTSAYSRLEFLLSTKLFSSYSSPHHLINHWLRNGIDLFPIESNQQCFVTHDCKRQSREAHRYYYQYSFEPRYNLITYLSGNRESGIWRTRAASIEVIPVIKVLLISMSNSMCLRSCLLWVSVDRFHR